MPKHRKQNHWTVWHRITHITYAWSLALKTQHTEDEGLEAKIEQAEVNLKSEWKCERMLQQIIKKTPSDPALKELIAKKLVVALIYPLIYPLIYLFI